MTTRRAAEKRTNDWRRCVVLVAVWLAVGLAPQSSGAQPGDTSSYSELLRKGADHYEANELKQAVQAWDKALAAAGEERGWKIHYNLGLAHESLNDPTRAVPQFKAFLTRVASEAASLSPALEQRREDAAARLKAIQQAHGAVVLRPQPERVTVTIDGGEEREVGFTAYLSAGDHLVVLTGPTGEKREERVTVAIGEQQVVDTRTPMPPAPPPAVTTASPPPPEPPSAEEPPEYPLTIVLIGVGVTAVSFALPGALWNIAASDFDDAEALGAGHTEYVAAVEEYNDSRDAYFASYALPAVLGAITLGIATWGIVHVYSGGSDDDVGLRLGPGAFAIDGRF